MDQNCLIATKPPRTLLSDLDLFQYGTPTFCPYFQDLLSRWFFFQTLYISKTYTSSTKILSGIPSHESLVISRYMHTSLLASVCIPRKYKRPAGYSMIYHENALHIYFITCRDRKYSGQHNHEWDIRVEHDEKVGFTTVQLQRLCCILIGCIFHGMV